MNDQYDLNARYFENEQAPEILTAETVREKVGDNNLVAVNLRDEEALCVISEDAFAGHGSMKAANFAGCSKLEKIGWRAFAVDSKLKIVSLAGCGKLSEIEDYAFAYCSELREVRAAGCDNITNIGNFAFAGCEKLTSFSIYDRAVDLVEYDIDFSGSRGLKTLETIGNYAFCSCESIETADFSCSGLKRIGDLAFSGCRSLEEISFNGCRCLTEIEGYAFSDCENLKCINLSGCDNLTRIGHGVFSRCRKLEKIDLSSCHGLTEIGNGVFSECEVLREILLPKEFFAGMTEQQQREKMNDILGDGSCFDIECCGGDYGNYKITVDRQRHPEQQHEVDMDNAEISEDEHEDSFENNDWYGGNMIAEPGQAQEESEPYEPQREADNEQQPEQQFEVINIDDLLRNEPQREAVDINEIAQQDNGRNRAQARGQNAHIAQNGAQARQGQAQLQ